MLIFLCLIPSVDHDHLPFHFFVSFHLLLLSLFFFILSFSDLFLLLLIFLLLVIVPLRF